jgi:Putative porin
MKRVTAIALFMILAGGSLSVTLGQTSSSGSTGSTAKRSTRKKAARSSVSQDLQDLRQMMQAQQQQMQQLQDQLQSRDQKISQLEQRLDQSQSAVTQAQSAATDAASKASSVETVANQQQDSVSKLSNDMADVRTTLTNTAISAQEDQKRVSALEGLLGRFRFNGDVRVRGESFFQNYSGCNVAGAAARCIDRNRARVRVRFGFDGKLNEDFVAGIALATGSLGDPTTTNETFTNFFDRKTIALDRGYITYNPVAHKWLSLTGGKFPFSWQRTSVTFDPDLNPEGFSEKLSFDLNKPVIKNLTVQGMQLLFSENNSASFLRGADSFAVGAQVLTKIVLGPLTSTPSATILNWRNTDALLNASSFAVQATTTGTAGTTPAGPFNVPGEGPGCAGGTGLPSFPSCAFAPNGMTNSTFIGADGKPHFASHFLYGDLILNNVVKTGMPRLPFNLILEAEQNLRAAAHPVDRTVNALVTPGLGRQSHAYLIDASIGQTKNKNDFQVGYAFLRQEQDAVLASFTESDQRAPTNILQHRVYGLWKLRSNVVAAYTLWIGRTLNENLQHAVLAPGFSPTVGPTEPDLKRMQFDLIYSF